MGEGREEKGGKREEGEIERGEKLDVIWKGREEEKGGGREEEGEIEEKIRQTEEKLREKVSIFCSFQSCVC